MSTYVLSETSEVIERDGVHFAFVEEEGPLGEAAMKCWMDLFTNHISYLKTHEKFTVLSNISMFRAKPAPVYRAGCVLSNAAPELNEGLKYEFVSGGKYAKFTVTGPYSTLPEARERIFQIVEETNMDVRDAFYISYYGNDPKDTPEEQLVTFILVPLNK
jgi:DNA gyrase inhibitor GyrI